jgi:glycerophosphoryl diester phosphodiesterase
VLDLRTLLAGRPVPSWLRERPVAHRGLHDAVRPENSLAAFEAAAEAGHPIELDVHLTADGGVVVFHDDTLDRMTGRPGKLREHTLAELTALRLRGSDEPVPSLAQALERVAGRVPVLVELKTHGPAGRLEPAVCDVLAHAPGEHAVQSFDPWSMLWMRRHAPHLPRGMLSGNMRSEGLPRHQALAVENLLLAPAVLPDFIGYELGALPHWAPSLWRRLGRPLLAWTIRDESALSRARGLVDNVIFEGVSP